MNGLETLRWMAQIIEAETGAKNLVSTSTAGVYVQRREDAHVAMDLIKGQDPESGCWRIAFNGCICQMGVWQTEDELAQVAKEVAHAAEVIRQLNELCITVTDDELNAFQTELEDQKQAAGPQLEM